VAETRKSTTLRRAIERGCVVIPGASNAITARLIERAGFEAVYVSGAGLANATAGVPDIGLLSLAEVAQLCKYICDATSIPALADADTGFGGLSNVAQTVREFERVGLAGMHIEDQEFPKRCGHLAGKAVIPSYDMEEKIRAAVGARRDKDFLIVARTDAHAVEDFDSTVRRALAYVQAGADAIFAEALQSPQEFKRFAELVKAPLLANMTEFGKSPLLSVPELAAMGYRMVIMPMSAFRISCKAIESFLSDVKNSGTQKPWLDKMQTRKELYDLLGYDPSKDQWEPRR
jgi:methylisocitrate lyase